MFAILIRRKLRNGRYAGENRMNVFPSFSLQESNIYLSKHCKWNSLARNSNKVFNNSSDVDNNRTRTVKLYTHMNKVSIPLKGQAIGYEKCVVYVIIGIGT